MYQCVYLVGTPPLRRRTGMNMNRRESDSESWIILKKIYSYGTPCNFYECTSIWTWLITWLEGSGEGQESDVRGRVWWSVRRGLIQGSAKRLKYLILWTAWCKWLYRWFKNDKKDQNGWSVLFCSAICSVRRSSTSGSADLERINI